MRDLQSVQNHKMKSIQHVAFNCRNVSASEAFYSKHFGFRRARVFNPGAPNEFVMLRLEATCIELFQGKGETVSTERGGEQAIGFKHLAFEVPDLEQALEKLRADGIEPEPIIDCGRDVPGLRICFFRDPDGNILELMQGWQDQSF
jgi:glyoxylase I family protein